MNKVFLSGNLGRDPELNDKGTVCNLSVATSGRKKVDGEYQDVTDWHRVVCIGKTAEFVARNFETGKGIVIEGKLQTRDYEKDGEKRYITEVLADKVEFAPGRKQESDPAPKKKYTKKPPADDDLPF